MDGLVCQFIEHEGKCIRRLTSSSNTNRLGDGQNLRVLKQTGVGGKAGVDAQARGEQAEGVAAAEAVACCDDLVDAARLQVGHAGCEDGVDRGRVVKKGPLRRVEAGRG